MGRMPEAECVRLLMWPGSVDAKQGSRIVLLQLLCVFWSDPDVCA